MTAPITPKNTAVRRATLLAVCVSTAMLMLDIAVVNTALPSIASDLDTGVSALQWVIDAYTLALATVVLSAGSWADRRGRRHVFVIGILWFTTASLFCALAPNIWVLDLARAAQGIGGAVLFACSLALLADVFEKGPQRATALAAYGATIGGAFAVGPLVGGLLTELLDWRAIFLINVPIGLITLAMTVRWVPESRDPRPRRADVPGQILVSTGLAALVFGLLRGNEDGWFEPQPMIAAVIAATIPNGGHHVSFGWSWNVMTTNAGKKFTYEFIPMNDSGLPGNPKNKLRLSSTGSSTGDTVNEVGASIGYYSSFQGKKLAISVSCQSISGGTFSIPILIQRTGKAPRDTPITVGSIECTPTFSAKEISFTVPELTSGDYSNSGRLNLYYSLPLNADFVIDFTCTWLQESESGEVEISESSTQLDAVRQLFGDGFSPLQRDDVANFYGYPLAMSQGSVGFSSNTGVIFSAPTGTETYYTFCVNLKSEKYLLANQVYQDCPTNRMITLIQGGVTPESFRRSENTFIFPSATATTLQVSTGLATKPLTAWQSFGTKVVITKPTDEFEMKVKASIDYESGKNNGKIAITWTSNGIVTPGFYNPHSYNAPIFNGGSFEDGTLPLTSYLGYFESIGLDSDGKASEAVFKQYLYMYSGSNGTATTQAHCYFRLGKLNFRNAGLNGDQSEGNYTLSLDTAINLEKPTYLKSLNMQYLFDNNPRTLRDYKTGFLTWNDHGETYNALSNVQKYILGFNVDSDNAANVPAAISGGIRKIISISSEDDQIEVISKIVETINNPFIHLLTFGTELPVSGATDKSYISSKGVNFVIIPWNKTTDPTKPANPDLDRTPIYCEFESTTTIPALIDTYKAAISSAIVGIPTSGALGIEMSEGIDNYMHL